MLQLQDMINSLKSSKETIGREKTTALNNIGTQLANKVKQYTPVDTGKLRDSIHHTITDDAVEITTDVEYAPYVDLGHAAGDKFINGRHMFNKAFLQADEFVDPAINQFLSKIKILE